MTGGHDRDRDERALVEAAQRGEPDARDELFRRALPGLEAFVRRKASPALRDRAGEPDLVQSICREVVRDLGDFEYRGEGSLQNWLLTRAENKLHNVHRAEFAQRRDPERVADGSVSQLPTQSTPSRNAERNEAAERLRAAMNGLPADYCQIVDLIRLQGLSYAEASARMGRSEGALRVLFTRAMSKLGKVLRPEG